MSIRTDTCITGRISVSNNHHEHSDLNVVKVAVPPGKLGLTLCENKEDTLSPASHIRITAVHPTSPVFQRIYEGDLLLTVENEFVTNFKLEQILQLLADKIHSERVLEVLRSKKMTKVSNEEQSSTPAKEDSKVKKDDKTQLRVPAPSGFPTNVPGKESYATSRQVDSKPKTYNDKPKFKKDPGQPEHIIFTDEMQACRGITNNVSGVPYPGDCTIQPGQTLKKNPGQPEHLVLSDEMQTITSGVPCPGAYNIQPGQASQLQSPGVISPCEDEATETTIDELCQSHPSEGIDSSIIQVSDNEDGMIPLAAEVAENNNNVDVAEQVRRYMEQNAVTAQEVVPMSLPDDVDVEAGTTHIENKSNATTHSKKNFCRWWIVFIMLGLLIIGVGVAVAITVTTRGNSTTSDQNTFDHDTPSSTSAIPTTNNPTKTPEQETTEPVVTSKPTQFKTDPPTDVSPPTDPPTIPTSHPSTPTDPPTTPSTPTDPPTTPNTPTDPPTAPTSIPTTPELQLCDSNNDCSLGRDCAYESYTAQSKLVCCPNGASESIYGYKYENYPKGDEYTNTYFCQDQPDGARCPTNTLCESGVCIFSTCNQRQNTAELCEENADCKSNVCASGKCQEGQLEALEECDDNSDCSLGRDCAYESYTAQSKLVCCPNGASESIYGYKYENYPKGDEYTNTYFCQDQPDGARCPTNTLCESGVCIFSTCNQRQNTAELCEENADCKSNVCASGKCQEGQLEALEECDDNSDCSLGRDCAYESYTAQSKLVCCPNGASESIYGYKYENYPKGDEYTNTYFCQDQPDGARCPTNTLCESGVCIFSTCNQRQNTAELCEENADCKSNVCASGKCQEGQLEALEECDDNSDCSLGRDCAYESYTAQSKLVCCPNGASESIYGYKYENYPKGDEYTNTYFCQDQPDGANCPEDSLCESNSCLFGTCA